MATRIGRMLLGALLPAVLVLTYLGPAFGQVSVAPGGYGTQAQGNGGGFAGGYGGGRGRGGRGRGGRGRNRNRGTNTNTGGGQNGNGQAGQQALAPAQTYRFIPGTDVNPAPVVSDQGRVYAGTGSHTVSAFDKATGKLLWVFRPGGEVAASPAVGPDGTVYVTSYDHDVYALDGATGTKKWQFATGDVLATTPAIGANGMIYVGGYDHSLYALNASGVKQWQYVTGGPVTSPVVGPDGTIFFGADRVYAVDGTSGKAKWAFADGYVGNAPPLLDSSSGRVYIGTYDGTLYSLSSQSGRELWARSFSSPVTSAPALGADGTLYAASDRLYALSTRDGRVRWVVGNSDGEWSSPLVGPNGIVYAGCGDQSLYAVSVSTGRVRWTFPVLDGLKTAPAIGPQGNLYLASTGTGVVYAIDGLSGRPMWRSLPSAVVAGR